MNCRPGFGGSTPVPASRRMQVWLETVPLLLEKLDVKHVSLVCHSAGTVFLLNTLLQHRKILDPKAPYVALLGKYMNAKQIGRTLIVSRPMGPQRAFKNGHDDCSVKATQWHDLCVERHSRIYQSSSKPYSLVVRRRLQYCLQFVPKRAKGCKHRLTGQVRR